MGRIYASTSNEITKRETDNAKLAANMAAECIVLLKNNGTLPIKREGKIALFGGGARGTVKGGTGSGDVNTRSNTTLEQGFINAGFEIISKDWLDRNEKILKDSKAEYAEFISNKSAQTGTPSEYLSFNFPYSIPDDAPITDNDMIDETAVYVISRISGEGVDRKAQKGDYLLSENEMNNIVNKNINVYKSLYF